METDELLRKRLRDLADKCYRNNQYTFTDFLSLADRDIFYSMEKELSHVPSSLWDGEGQCERAMIRFGSQEMLGYTVDFPISCIMIKPVAERFAEELTHRDFLGALMNLGIERSVTGDIFVKGHTAYFYCLENMAPFIKENLNRVKHTVVSCQILDQLPFVEEQELLKVEVQVSSNRIDAVAAKVYGLSRSESTAFFRQKKIFVNGRICENNSQLLREQDQVSVRGYGKFVYCGIAGVSKKGKLHAQILCYGARKGRP